MRFVKRLLASVAFALAAAPGAALAQIEVGSLQELDAWAVGAVAARDGALPKDLWTGTDSAALAALFDRIPASVPSPIGRSLVYRALASSAFAPPGTDFEAAARKRFSALGRMGAADALATMTSAQSAASRDPEIAIFAMQAELSRGRLTQACARARAFTVEPAPAFVLRLRGFCFAVAGETAAADLALEVARANRASDEWLVRALPAVAGATGPKPPGRYDSSLHAAISLAGGFPDPRTGLNDASQLALGAVARHERASVPLRTVALSRALSSDLIGPDVARAAARSLAAATPAPRRGQRADPLLAAMAASEAATDDAARAAAIDQALDAARDGQTFIALARLFRPEVMALPRNETTSGAGLTLARAALALGEIDVAAGWRDVARYEEDPYQRALVDLAIAAAGYGGREAAGFAVDRLIDQASAANAGAAARAAVLVSALGLPQSAIAQAHLSANPPAGGVRADDGLLAALVSASQRKAAGETAILAGLILAPGAERIDANGLVSVMQALRSVGLDADARKVAVEALLAQARP